MKIIANKQQLITKLTATAEIASDNKIRPVLGCVKLSATDTGITLTATDLELTIISDVLLGEVIEAGDVVFRADKVIEYMATLGNSITLESTQGRLTISETDNEDTTADFPTMYESEFPTIRMISGELVTVESEPFAKCLSHCITVSRAVTYNVALEGVRLEINDRVACIASDSFRMIYSECAIENNSDIKVTVPNKTIFHILKLLKTCANVEISKVDNQMLFEFGDYKLMTRLIQLEFPEWEKLKDTLSFNKTVTVNTDKTRQTLKRVCIIARSNLTSKNAVIFKINKNKIELNSIAENGKIKDKIECMKEGEDIKINLNADFLLKYIETVESEAVEIKLNDSKKAIVLQGCGNNKTWFLTMPLAMIDD